MSWKSVLADPSVSFFVGFMGLVVYWPVLLGVAMVLVFSSDRPRSILRQVPVENHPLHTILVFNTRCRIGDFLRRQKLHLLPSLVCLVEGRLTALDLVEMDWSRFH